MDRIRIYRVIDTAEYVVRLRGDVFQAAEDYFDVQGGSTFTFTEDEVMFMKSFDFRTECDKAEEYVYSGW